MRWLPSVPYPPAKEAYWSTATATLNFCEEDYYATTFSAEIVNACTNVIFMWLAVKGITSCIRNDHDPVFLVAFAGYLTVGAGSFLFHSTLKYPMQLVDELSMIYTTCIMCFATFSYQKSRTYSIGLGIFLLGLSAFITGYYHYLQNPAFHQNAYALLTAIVLFRSMYVMEISLRPSLRARQSHAGQANGALGDVKRHTEESRNILNEQILRRMWSLIAYGLSIFLGGFAIWTLDNQYCGTIRRWRREIGLPWGVLLEGHGWWHLMTGTGAYCYIVWGIWLRHCLNGKQNEYDLEWPRILPSCVKRRKPLSSEQVLMSKGKKSS